MTVRVLLADDHGAIRDGLRLILTAQGIEVIGEAADGAVAVANARTLRPDVVVMDLRMPGTDGVQATREIVTEGTAEVLVLTSFDEDDLVMGAIRAGAAGFLLKTADGPTLADAVMRVAAGEGVLDPRVTRRALAALRDQAPAVTAAGVEELTDRERQVLDGIVRGASNARIGEELGISLATVKTHVSNVLVKLGAESRSHAAALVRAPSSDR